MEHVVTRTPGLMGGTPCFAGTRVPVSFLFEYLEAGYNVEYFVHEFPTVTREQALAVLAQASRRAEEEAVWVEPPYDEWDPKPAEATVSRRCCLTRTCRPSCGFC